MIIKLFKYEIPSSSDLLDSNYFRNPDIICLDYMILTNILREGFPSFTEEYTKQDDVNVIMASDYDLKFSLLQTEISNLGKNIKEFLLPDNTDARFFKLLCGFEFDGIQRWGMVDLTSIRANYTKPQNRYDVTFTVYEIFKEFMDAMKTEYADLGSIVILPNLLFDFDEFFGNSVLFFNRLQYWQVVIDNQLDINTRCGFNISIDNVVLDNIYQGGINQGYTLWAGLISIAIGLGFAMRLEIQNENYITHPRFKLVLFWRTTSSLALTKTVVVMEDEESNALLFDTQYLLIVYNYIPSGVNPYAKTYHGLLMRKDIYFMNDVSNYPEYPASIIYSSLNNSYYLANFAGTYYSSPIPGSYVTRLNLELHAGAGSPTPAQIPFCRILCETSYWDGKFNAIIEATARMEYQYLLAGVREKRDLKVSLLNNRNYKMFDLITYKDKNYGINRMTDVDLSYKTAKLEVIRI